jgi:predicted RNase H-related nuclease YkuK (DUF458 family)
VKDIALLDTGELSITTDIQVVEDVDQVVQAVRTRLRTFYGEWAFDTTQGVPYIEEIFVKAPNMKVVDGLLKAAILDTDGVVEFISYSSNYTPSTRTLTVTCEINTDYGYGQLEVVI